MSPRTYAEMLAAIQAKHHPESRDLGAGERSFLEGEYPEDEQDEDDVYGLNGGDE